MEILELSGYTFEEKAHIAREHLIPKQLPEHGLSADQMSISDEVLIKVITAYTREAGVQPRRRIAFDLCRAVAVDVASGKADGEITDADLQRILPSPEKFWNEVAERTEVPGVATGMAWTAAGGDLLFIEATRAWPGGIDSP